MKKLILISLFLSVLSLLFKMNFIVFAQVPDTSLSNPSETLQVPTEAAPSNSQTQQPISFTSQRTTKSNASCVRIGNPSSDKPSICSNTGFGVTGSAPAGNFTFYCQGNPQWDQKGNACSIGQIGCGPTSLAMIFSYFGDTVTPDQMYKTYEANRMISCDLGSFPGAVNAWVAKQPGYEVGPDIGSGVLNATEAKKFIDAGWIILASSDNFIGQRGKPIGHIFIVQDVDPAAQTFTLRDPENCSYSTGEEFTQNINQPILGGKVPSWKYAYPIRKNATAPQPQGVNQNAF